jgi:radical SAM-linked protein
VSAARAQPVQQAPPVQKLRVRYAKRGRARFTSSRDFGRAFERALRRAGVPMAYSSGFSPHPRISYANASPTGAASEAEYLEIGLAETRDPSSIQRALDAALPPGLDVVQVVEATTGALADLLTASRWRIDLVGIPPMVVDTAVEEVLAQESVVVERMTKGGVRAFDVRGAIVSLVRETGPDRCSVALVTLHQEPLVRPDDVLAAMTQRVPAFAPAEVPILIRLAQGQLGPEGRLLDPFRPADQDRVAGDRGSGGET